MTATNLPRILLSQRTIMLVVACAMMMASGCSGNLLTSSTGVPSASPPARSSSNSVASTSAVVSRTDEQSVVATALPAIPATSDLPAVSCKTCGLIPIADQRVAWLQWSATGDRLFYRTAEDSSYWEYQLDGCYAHPAPADWAEQTPEGARESRHMLPSSVRSNESQPSPSGQTTVFVETDVVGLEPPDDEGEGQGPTETSGRIYVLANGSTTPVHMWTVDGLVDGFTWFADEQRFLIRMSHRFPGSAYVWLGDLDQTELEPLLPVKPGEDGAVFRALAPEGNVLLYTRGVLLLLLDLSDGTERQISVLPNPGRAYYWFLSANKLLMVDDFSKALDFQVQVLDIESGEVCRQPESHLRIHSLELSPDNRYLAVLWEDSLGLYLHHLCGPCF